MQYSTGLTASLMSIQNYIAFTRFIMSILKLFPWQHKLCIQLTIFILFYYPPRFPLWFWALEFIVGCFSSGRSGKSSSAPRVTVDTIFLGILREYSFSFRIPAIMTGITAKTSEIFQGIFIFGIFSMDLQTSISKIIKRS